ncbi:hypothetical protein SteCoe_4580 [Stentor coeruleus]|uniref:DUF4378 domain-containing protein n=1 Tax=Stentor coeruleus TaxID=5963 RepID=A0A1R2CUB3_9CILI|nr:hypothetical protein SteCoe_4580 [Stentor coeruleus]
MDSYLKLNSLCASPSSFYLTGFLTPKSTVKKLILQSPPIIGRCISEIQISSEKSSPLPTPIILNFTKPKTPTSIIKPSFTPKKLSRPESQVKKAKEKTKLKLVSEKPKKRKILLKSKLEMKKVIPEEEKTKKSKDNHRKIKELSKHIRKMNLKFKTKKFLPMSPWGIDSNKVVEETRLKREAENTKKPKPKAEKHKKKLKKPLKKPINKIPEEKKVASAIKIQAFYRGYIARKVVKSYLAAKNIEYSSQIKPSSIISETFTAEDQEVRFITERSEKPTKPKMIPILSLEESGSYQIEELKPEILTENKEEEKVKFTQNALKVKKQNKLQELKQADMQEMLLIAEKLGNKPEIVDLLNSILNRRYEKISKIFDEHLENLKDSIKNSGNKKVIDSPDLDTILHAISSKDNRQTSGEISEDIEKIWLQIEQHHDETNNHSFLKDPQPLPPLTPIIEDSIDRPGIDCPFDNPNEYAKGEKNCVENKEDCKFNKENKEDFSEKDEENLKENGLEHDNSVKMESFADSPKNMFENNTPVSLSKLVIKIVPAQEKSEEGALRSFIHDFDTKEPTHPKEFINDINFQDLSSMTLEHSDALKDYSSIIPSPAVEKEDLDSLEYELDLKTKSSIKTSNWPITSRQIFERDSPSNPFSITGGSEKPTDHSGEELLVDRAVSLLELIIYHDIIEDSHLFEDIDFTIGLLEDLINKEILICIGEATRPKIVRHNTLTNVKSDSSSVLQVVDKLFLHFLKNPNDIKAHMQIATHSYIFLQCAHENIPIEHQKNSICYLPEDPSLDKYTKVHTNMIINSCEEIIFRQLLEFKSSLFQSFSDKIDTLKLSDFFMAVRDQLLKWNEIQAGNIPGADVINENGVLDEDKLQNVRSKNLAKLLYSNLEDDEQMWVNYTAETEYLIIQLEDFVFCDLVEEIVDFMK